MILCFYEWERVNVVMATTKGETEYVGWDKEKEMKLEGGKVTLKCAQYNE